MEAKQVYKTLILGQLEASQLVNSLLASLPIAPIYSILWVRAGVAESAYLLGFSLSRDFRLGRNSLGRSARLSHCFAGALGL